MTDLFKTLGDIYLPIYGNGGAAPKVAHIEAMGAEWSTASKRRKKAIRKELKQTLK